jgi:competence protein ComEA
VRDDRPFDDVDDPTHRPAPSVSPPDADEVRPDPLAAFDQPAGRWRDVSYRLVELAAWGRRWRGSRAAALLGAIATIVVVAVVLTGRAGDPASARPAEGSTADPWASAGVSGTRPGGTDGTNGPSGTTGAAAPPGTATPSGDGASAMSGAGPATTAPSGAWVAIAGAVPRPGVYRVPPAARLSELVALAGGLAPDADPDRINLAAVVLDGERVYVPHRGEQTAPAVIDGTGSGDSPGTAPGSGGAGSSGGGAAGSAPSASHPLDLNEATADQLDALPGVGPATAAAIVAYRTQHGPFRSVDDLEQVRGIGPAKLDQIRGLVTV